VNPGEGWGLRGAWGGQPIQGSTLVTLPTALCSFYATNSASPKRNPATEGGCRGRGSPDPGVKGGYKERGSVGAIPPTVLSSFSPYLISSP
jgi:hypothetical protein